MLFKKYQRILFALLILLISYLGFSYRIRGYQVIPYVHNSWDEQEYLWLGKSLLTSGVPASWSSLPIYFSDQLKTVAENYKLRTVKGFNIQINEHSFNLSSWKNPLLPHFVYLDIQSTVEGYTSNFRIVQPQLDNPPLAGLIFAAFDNNGNLYHSSVKTIRLIAIFFTTLTVAGIFLLSFKLYKLPTAIISSLIYALGPGYVVSGRLAVPENIIAAIYTFALLILVFYNQKETKLKFWGLLLICFFSPLLKLVGVIVPLGLSLILASEKKIRQSLLLLLSGFLGIMAYVIYGLFYNKNIFLMMLSNQTERNFMGPISVLFKFMLPHFTAPMYDGWLILGFISVFLALKSFTFKDHLIPLAIVAHLIFFLFFGGDNYPWYLFIIFPLLSITAGYCINHFLTNPHFGFNVLFYIVVLSSLLYYALLGTKWPEFLNIYRILTFVALLLPLIPLIFKKPLQRYLQISLVVMLLGSFYLSTRIINNFQFLWPQLYQQDYQLTK
jgi:4-amino-4-deoxy-L-arabinose transferase-like glycosyltransferase